MKFYICKSRNNELFVKSELSIKDINDLKALNIVGSCYLNDDKLIQQCEDHKEYYLRTQKEIDSEDKEVNLEG